MQQAAAVTIEISLAERRLRLPHVLPYGAPIPMRGWICKVE